jgi:DNA-binding NarL/FixJ family response regulator
LGEDRNTNATTNANGPIRVLLADDHTMFREGLAGIMASYGGMEVIAEVQYVRGLTGVGASAYLLKTSSSEHLVAAVRAAVLDPASENAVVGMPRSMLEGAEEGIDSVLSVRELEILLLAARGLSNHQISSSVYLAEGTVKRHLANVYQKMGVGSRGEASREALLREWITIEDLTAEEHGQADWPSEQG